MFGKEMREDWVIKDEIRKCAMSLGEVYQIQLNYPAWRYYLLSVVKPSLRQAFHKYGNNHRAELFVSERNPKAMGWQ